MDMSSLVMTLAVLKKIPDTAVSLSMENAERAETAATLAQQHSIGFVDDGTGLILQPIEEE